MAWLLVVIAGAFECVWAIGLKYTEGFTRLGPAIPTVLAMATSLGCLTLALKTLPLGTAYAVWTGIGAAGTALLGIYLFNESATPLRLASLALVVLGLIGLKLAE